jgi:predicted DNA-binding antitoxin AbrB/MazE fold protein
MGKAIECIYENNVLKPVGKVLLKEGERIRVTIERKLPFEPIQLKKKPSSEEISALRDETWTSSKIHLLSSRCS